MQETSAVIYYYEGLEELIERVVSSFRSIG